MWNVKSGRAPFRFHMSHSTFHITHLPNPIAAGPSLGHTNVPVMSTTAAPAFSAGTIVSAMRDQVSCQIDLEAVILNLTSGVYFGLNEVGARIWALLQAPGPHTVGELEAAIAAEFDVTPEACARDVRALLEQFHAAGLLEVSGVPAR